MIATIRPILSDIAANTWGLHRCRTIAKRFSAKSRLSGLKEHILLFVNVVMYRPCAADHTAGRLVFNRCGEDS
jgi:hypothetical protein